MQPFLKYSGGKWRSALRYPAPIYDRIVEPFAGSAGYSTRYPDRKVVLIDSDERVCIAWAYLLRVSESEFLRLPILQPGQSVWECDAPADAQHFLAFRVNVAAGPRTSATRWMLWNESVRRTLASQLDRIRHWTIVNANYEAAEDFPSATYFIDPPYQHKQIYRDKITDFAALAAWVKSLDGQVIVCEGPGADWLPFETLTRVKTHPNAKAATSEELVYVR